MSSAPTPTPTKEELPAPIVTILNGSLGGRTGNTNNLLQKVKRIIHKEDSRTKINLIHLSPHF